MERLKIRCNYEITSTSSCLLQFAEKAQRNFEHPAQVFNTELRFHQKSHLPLILKTLMISEPTARSFLAEKEACATIEKHIAEACEIRGSGWEFIYPVKGHRCY